MVTFKAATPHPIHLMLPNKERFIVPALNRAKYGDPPRLQQQLRFAYTLPNGMRVYSEDNPERRSLTNIPLPEEDVIWLIGAAFIGHPALKYRHDILAVDSQRDTVYIDGIRWVTRLLKVSK